MGFKTGFQPAKAYGEATFVKAAATSVAEPKNQ
jgi:hypothetical protein